MALADVLWQSFGRSISTCMLEQTAPGVLTLGIGTNDLVDTSPVVVGSEIEI